jgi:hypothetical protein
MEQMLKDQALLAKKMENTGRAVAQLSLTQAKPHQESRPQQTGFAADSEVHQNSPHPHISGNYSGMNHKSSLPKMSFPIFTCENPKIWKDKCLDYFSIFNLPERLWVQYASVNFDGPTAKWLQVYKLKTGLSDWPSFTIAVESQFGSYDYRDAITDLVSLSQDGALEDYITSFVDLQYQVQMHNQGLDELYFVTQFISGLKPELAAAV